MGEEHEISYIPSAIVGTIRDLPSASVIALDVLRKNPLSYDSFETLSEIAEQHGEQVSDLYHFFGKVINSNSFFSIDFEPRVDNYVENDPSQVEIEDKLLNKHLSERGYDDLSPEKVVSLSRRAAFLKAVGELAIIDQFVLMKTSKTKTKAGEQKIAEIVPLRIQAEEA